MLTVNKSRWYYLLTMMRSGLSYGTIILLLLCGVIPANATSFVSSENELRKSVIALDRARHSAVHDLAEKKQNADLEEQQQQDYERFIIFLTQKINEYCQQLRSEVNESAVEGLPCPEAVQTLGAVQETGPIQTSDEQVEELERLLADSLEKFDEKLLKEEERIATRQPKDRETGYGHGGSQGQGSGEGIAGTDQTSGQGSGSGQSAGSEGKTGHDSQDGETDETRTGQDTGGSASGTGDESTATAGKGEGTSGAGSGSGHSTGSSQQPGKVELEAGDDDVVARQLREAAENETDPELKKKLWEEYRKYKEGIR
jgi:hypothetical protein